MEKRTAWLEHGSAGGVWFKVKLKPWVGARSYQVLIGCVKDLGLLSGQPLKGFNLFMICSYLVASLGSET